MPSIPDDSASDFVAKVAQAGTSEVALLHFLLENIPVRIYFKDQESRFIRISRAMAKFHGLESSLAAVGKTDFDVFTREHAEAAFADEQRVMQTGQAIVDKVEKETLPGGKVRWAVTTKMPLRNPHGEIVGTCGITQDVTAHKELEDALVVSNEELRKRQQQLETALAALNEAHQKVKSMQQQLVEAEKLQALGRFAYGVAHEIRNPLNICQMGLEFFQNAPSVLENPVQKEIVQEMKVAISRADAVISTLMGMTSPDTLQLEPHDLRDIIEPGLAAQAADCEQRGIKIIRDFVADVPRIDLDRSSMEQVFVGVITNALAAMKPGGELTVRTRLRRLTDEEITRDPGLRSFGRLRAGETVAVVEIDDTGSGIPPELLTKVFDPFFTTKETGKGTGLGLTVCRKVVELHGGSVHIANRMEGGVRVSIVFKLPMR